MADPPPRESQSRAGARQLLIGLLLARSSQDEHSVGSGVKVRGPPVRVFTDGRWSGGERKGNAGNRWKRRRGGRGESEYRAGGVWGGGTNRKRKDRTVDKTRRQTDNKQECVMLRWS